MTRAVAALLALASAASPVLAQPSGLEGHWANPKHTTVVNVSHCDGDNYCAVVLKASPKAQANARKGGTQHFIGTEILRVRQAGDGVFKGTAFDPGQMEIRGCALLGLVCQSQRWSKVS